MEPLDLRLVEAARLAQLQEPLGPRECREGRASHGRPVAQLLCQCSLDDGGLAAGDPLADHERGRGLVRRVEADGAKVVELALRCAHDRVPGTHRRPAGTVVVERERAGRLADCRLTDRRRGVGAATDDAVRVLPQLQGNALVRALRWECQRDRVLANAPAADAGGKAVGETTGGGKAEGASGDDLDLEHRGV